MVRCPSCGNPGIGAFEYAFARSFVPAKCRMCGEFASPSEWTLALTYTVLQVTLLGALILAALRWHWWPLVSFLLVWLLLDVSIILFSKPLPRRSPVRGLPLVFWGFVIVSFSALGLMVFDMVRN